MELNVSEQSLDWLASAVTNGDRDTRIAVAYELGSRLRSGERRALNLLVAMLEDEDQYVPETASDMLRDTKDALPLTLSLLQDRLRPVGGRQLAARTLGNIGDPRAVQALAEVVSDDADDLRLRRTAVTYLGRTRDSSAIELLVRLLQDDKADGESRLAAARGLGEIRDPRAIAALEEQLGRPDTWVMTEALIGHIEQVRGLRPQAEGKNLEELDRLIREAERGRSLHHEIRNALFESR